MKPYAHLECCEAKSFAKNGIFEINFDFFQKNDFFRKLGFSQICRKFFKNTLNPTLTSLTLEAD
jgi:hypothetical protein